MKLRTGKPYWLAVDCDARSIGSEALFSGDVRCSVVVLGGGITGALAAYRLTTQGVDVVLVDEREFGHGSSAASTGLLQYEVDTPLAELIDQVGEQNAVRAYRRGLTAIDEIEQLVGELELDCGFSRRESLYFASSIWHRSSLERECELRRQVGFDVEFLNREQLAEISTLQAAGAILSRGDAQIDPYRFTRELLRAAVRQGLRAYAKTKVVSVCEADSCVTLVTETGRIIADKIVYATGYATKPFLAGESAGKLHSTYAVISEPLGEVPGWPNQCLLWETARPYFYARRTDDGRALIGGGDTLFSNDHERDGLVDRKVEKLVERFQELFPGATFVPDYAWAGTFAETKDGLAYIGSPPDRPRAYFALGYGGNGITFSVIASQVITDLYFGRPNPDAEVFRFER
ncbi:Gamma-glutamylputrescine oxidoreductase [Anatilimnocola aggregata]|uniref:Gamma-glutamylputrescine oxidoreductase n=1 Tax=Anatilimnocola aggregata TaxID=2528021 RepID=A0A517YET6_9BACT|nr:FAD-binding oxidoreductase [Anatilimnocola aggregata]QDU28756.1 Gamma-glutamylputrescine oxidoreductase [Anatilimnocola aggregata]